MNAQKETSAIQRIPVVRQGTIAAPVRGQNLPHRVHTQQVQSFLITELPAIEQRVKSARQIPPHGRIGKIRRAWSRRGFGLSALINANNSLEGIRLTKSPPYLIARPVRRRQWSDEEMDVHLDLRLGPVKAASLDSTPSHARPARGPERRGGALPARKAGKF